MAIVGQYVDLYPFPPALDEEELLFRLDLKNFQIILRNTFFAFEEWEQSTAEVSYRRSPLRAGIKTSFAPEGFQWVDLTFSFNPASLRLSLGARVTAQGPSSAFLSFGLVSKRADLKLRADIDFPFELHSAEIQVRILF